MLTDAFFLKSEFTYLPSPSYRAAAVGIGNTWLHTTICGCNTATGQDSSNPVKYMVLETLCRLRLHAPRCLSESQMILRKSSGSWQLRPPRRWTDFPFILTTVFTDSYEKIGLEMTDAQKALPAHSNTAKTFLQPYRIIPAISRHISTPSHPCP